MYCPSCGSSDLTKLSLLHISGIRDVRTKTVGLGRGLYIGKNRGTSQTRVSQMASPPRPRRAGTVILIWLGVGLIVAWAGALIQTAQNAQPRFGSRNSHVHQILPPTTARTRPESTLTLKALGVAATVMYVVSLPLFLRSARRYNTDVYGPAMRRWDASFMCQRLGKFSKCRNKYRQW